jgi:translation initiation factor 1 (eIF-1/SUI1)
VSIRVEKNRNKWLTIITGLHYSMDAGASSDKDLLRKLKRDICSCNGVIAEDGSLQMQGDHRDAIVRYLLGIGINRSLIIM